MSNQTIQRQLAKRAQTARYMVYVDNQAKSSFDSREAADKEALRISSAFPILTVRVGDTENDSATALSAILASQEVNEPATE